MAGRGEMLLKCDVPGAYEVWQVPRPINDSIAGVLSCNPIYQAQVLLFTFMVNNTDMTNSFNPSTLTFPPKTGYIQDTYGGEALRQPKCSYYNTTAFQNLTFEMNPDPTTLHNCTHKHITTASGITVNFTGKIYGINKLYFRHDRPLAVLLPNQTYQFTLTFFPHPIHHHINPFQLRDSVGHGFLGQPGEWRDVISPGCNASGSVVVRTRTLDYVGKVVMHCHFFAS